MKNSACFTGHRIIAKEEISALRNKVYEIAEKLILEGVTDFFCGGAIGFDTLAAEVILSLRNKYAHIRLHIIVPCENQEKMWTKESKEKYYEINEAADEVKCLSDRYYNGCMHVRNHYMVNNTDICIAYLTTPAGGTAATARYAQNEGKTVIIINTKENN